MQNSNQDNNQINTKRKISQIEEHQEKYKQIEKKLKQIDYESDDAAKQLKKKNKFTAMSELSRAKLIVYHEPHIENFLFGLHPIGALFEDESLCKERLKYDFHFLRDELQRLNVNHISVRDALKKNIKQLKEFAVKSLKYYPVDDIPEQYQYYISDEYKKKVIDGLAQDSIVDIVLNRPIVFLQFTDTNTKFSIQRIDSRPIGNLIFCRDQQITTQKGVVIGRLNSPQRTHEIEIMKVVFQNLGIKPIGHVPTQGRLEGGDFMIIKEDLALLGIGLRSNFDAAFYLMKNDLLGTKRFGLVLDDFDLDQQRMHLDTIFNIVSKDTVMILDFETTDKVQKHYLTLEQMKRKINVYEKIQEGQDDDSQEAQFTGDYRLVIQEMDFEEYLMNEGYKIIKITNKQQLEYMINFINLGPSEDHEGKFDIIAVHSELQKHLEANGCFQANVHVIEFTSVKKMYGAIHCATQISRHRK